MYRFENVLKRFLPCLFLFAVWFVFSSPYLIKHNIPYPSQYQVSFFTPWNAYPQYAFPIKNNAIPDVVDQIYPWKHFTIEQLKMGELPVWNPYSFSGTPHLANYQTAVLSPFNLLYFVLPFIDAWSLVVLLQPLLAGIFVYLFLRELKISQVGAVVGSVAYMFCGFITVWMPYGTLSMTVAFLPLCLFAIEKYFTSSQFRYLILLAISICIAFFSGHFQIALYTACFIFAYLVFSFFRIHDKRASIFVFLGFLAGIIISLIQILPSLQFYRFAVRSESFSNANAIPWYYLVTSFAPDFFGNPVTRNDWIRHYAEWGSFIGIIPLTLAFISLFIKKQKAIILFFFFAGVVALLLAIDTPLQQLLTMLKLPIFSTSIPSRMIVLFSFSFAVLSGFGFDYLSERLHQKSLKQIIFFLLPTVVLLAVVWISVFVFRFIPADKLSIAKKNILLPTALFIVFAAGVFFTQIVKKKYLITVFAVLVLLLTAFDSLRFAQKWMPFEDRSVLYPIVPVIQAMQQHIGNGRVYGGLGAYVSVYYHLPVVDGYDPLFSRRYGELIQSASTGMFTPALHSSEVVLDKRGKYTQRMLDLLGVTLIYQPISESNQPWAFPVWEQPKNFPTVYRDDRFAVFDNSTALPRVRLFSQYEVIPDEKKLVERFFEKNFDYRNVLLLEEEPGLVKSSKLKVQSDARIVSYTPNKVVVSVDATQPALLFLSDSYYPAWHATVNGKEEKILVADHALRAVKVPQGESTVIFTYSGLF